MGGFCRPIPVLRDALGEIDAESLAVEKIRVAPWVAEKLTSPTHSVRRQLELWERLGVRIRDNWLPDGSYLVDEYVNDLDTRDSLEETSAALHGPAAERFRSVLGRLDKAFRELTFEDGGASIAWRLNETKSDLALRPWWWSRRPVWASWA